MLNEAVCVLPALKALKLKRARIVASKRHFQTRDQAFVIEWFAQKTICTGLQGGRADFCFGKCGDKDNRRSVSIGNQPILQFDTGHARHLHVGDQAGCVRNTVRPKIVFCRRECGGGIAQ